MVKSKAKSEERSKRKFKFRVLIEVDEDGVFVASCPSLPGCVSQGKTRKKAEANIKEAIEVYLESLQKHEEPIPPPIEESDRGDIVTKLPVVSGKRLIAALKKDRIRSRSSEG